jgi:hypothetical protein
MSAIRSRGSRQNIIYSNIKHAVKYGDYNQIKYLYDVTVEDILGLKGKEFREAVVLATVIHVVFCRKGIYAGEEIPKWILDKRIYLDVPYKSRYWEPIDFLMAYAEEYQHNVYLPKSSYDVM